MIIDKHKWSDEELAFVDCDSVAITLKAFRYQDCYGDDCYIQIEKQDAIATAKHFNEDRESLVLKIKELIAEYQDFADSGRQAVDLKHVKNSLQNLINPAKELTKEEI